MMLLKVFCFCFGWQIELIVKLISKPTCHHTSGPHCTYFTKPEIFSKCSTLSQKSSKWLNGIMIWYAASKEYTLNENALSEELLESFSLQQTACISYKIRYPPSPPSPLFNPNQGRDSVIN